MVITQLTLLTSNLNATSDFYSGVLGFPILQKSERQISFSVGHTVLSFLFTDKNPCYHFAFSIPSNKVEEAHSYISRKTTILPYDTQTSIADFSNWNAHAFYLHDNQNNILEFIAHHDLQNDTANTFDTSSVIGVCEIGIPVEDVTETCKTIADKLEVRYFKKGPRLENFSVMGDEQGLFIVTKIGRGWLPTQEPSRPYFIKLTFENAGKKRSFSFGDD